MLKHNSRPYPSTAASSPTSVPTCSALPESGTLTKHKTAQRSKSREERTQCLQKSLLWRATAGFRGIKACNESFGSCWMGVKCNCLCNKMHYHKANRETVSCAGGEHDRLMAETQKQVETLHWSWCFILVCALWEWHYPSNKDGCSPLASMP